LPCDKTLFRAALEDKREVIFHVVEGFEQRRYQERPFLLGSGTDIRFVQRLLGHASIATTEIYTHVSDKALQKAVMEADAIGAVY